MRASHLISQKLCNVSYDRLKVAKGGGALGDGMIKRDIYLMNAALLCAIAEAEKDSTIRADLESMAYAYLHLAQDGGRAGVGAVVGGTRRAVQKSRYYQSYYDACMRR